MSKTATINGQSYALREGETILQFVERHIGKRTIPTLCNDERLEPFGACRVCAVEVALQPDGPRRVVAYWKRNSSPGRAN